MSRGALLTVDVDGIALLGESVAVTSGDSLYPLALLPFKEVEERGPTSTVTPIFTAVVVK